MNNNFTEHMQSGQLRGRNLKSADKAAMESLDRAQERRTEDPFGIQPSMPGTDWQKDWRDRERITKRALRGGATFRKGDMIAGE